MILPSGGRDPGSNPGGAIFIMVKYRILRKILRKLGFEQRRDKSEIIQDIFDKIKGKTYLEIGIAEGRNFVKVKAKNKIGVDPKIIPPKVRRKIKINRLIGKNIKYFQMKSNDFFKNEAEKLFKKNKSDVAFIDGLHEYHQVLRDVENCLKYLTDKGVIVLHDCNPHSEIVAMPEKVRNKVKKKREEAKDKIKKERLTETNVWTGDVWKAVVSIRSFKKEVKVFTLKSNRGLGIITRGNPENIINYSKKEIEEMTYADLEKNREKFLNLKDKEYLTEFLESLT